MLLGGDAARELAVAAAATCYALNAVVSKGLVGYSRLALVAPILCVSALMAVAGSLTMPNAWTFTPAPAALGVVAILGVVQTGLAYLVMLTIVRRQGAGFFSQVNFLIPLVGVAWGLSVMGETISIRGVFALILILAGLAVARAGRGRGQRATKG
jgi:drug/metabolite transporter (DMT)-like permease